METSKQVWKGKQQEPRKCEPFNESHKKTHSKTSLQELKLTRRLTGRQPQIKTTSLEDDLN